MANLNNVPNYAVTGAYETCPEGFSSANAGGVFFAFCDGSVRFISENIALQTYRAQATRDVGEVFAEP